MKALFVFSLACGLLLASLVFAQATRSGIRISFTQIDSQSGAMGSAFLPISSRDVIPLPATRAEACAFSRARSAMSVTGNLPRGPIRRVVVSYESATTDAVPLRNSGCPRAWIETTLEDGTVLAGGHGEVRITDFGDGGTPIRGTFSQTADRGGVPTTIRGEFTAVLPARAN